MDWQPIETAPKDGTRVLLARFIDCAKYRHLPRTGWIKVGRWVGHYLDGYENKWRENSVPEVPIGSERIGLCPTHWMPLPEPPK